MSRRKPIEPYELGVIEFMGTKFHFGVDLVPVKLFIGVVTATLIVWVLN